ncbi:MULTISPECIES: hypothetical protein [Neisseria]|uniref:hypothetical protein n=1 Tax=Neisseria TaxID=482 RepID=UPI00128C8747|nr:hypothetical protein [Neisseria arctica]UOO86599.1 hypothetical protein LVJ86_10505 [Neisseria arctica]
MKNTAMVTALEISTNVRKQPYICEELVKMDFYTNSSLLKATAYFLTMLYRRALYSDFTLKIAKATR